MYMYNSTAKLPHNTFILLWSPLHFHILSLFCLILPLKKLRLAGLLCYISVYPVPIYIRHWPYTSYICILLSTGYKLRLIMMSCVYLPQCLPIWPTISYIILMLLFLSHKKCYPYLMCRYASYHLITNVHILNLNYAFELRSQVSHCCVSILC